MIRERNHKKSSTLQSKCMRYVLYMKVVKEKSDFEIGHFEQTVFYPQNFYLQNFYLIATYKMGNSDLPLFPTRTQSLQLFAT